MNQTEMESFLDNLYQRHIEKLSKIELLDILRSNIPYLPRILGMQKIFRIATGILDAYMDSFGETLALTKDGASHLRIGQAYWRREIDNLDFYVKLISLTSDYTSPYRSDFELEWDKATNRFTRDFLINFGNPDGSINWEKLVRFNSRIEKVLWISSKDLPI